MGLSEIVAVLLLQASDLVHVDGVELALGLLLIGRELLLAHGLEANSSIVSDANNKDTSTLGAALLILLIREGNVNLRDVVGRVRRRVWIGEHRLAITTNDKDAGAAVVCCLNGKTAVVGGALSIVVCGKEAVLLSAHELDTTSSAK